MKKTPEQKAAEYRRSAQSALFTRIASAVNFGKAKTWRDVYAFTTAPEGATNLDIPVTQPELKAYFIKQKQLMEAEIAKSVSERSEDRVSVTKRPVPLTYIAKPILPDSPTINLTPTRTDNATPPTNNLVDEAIKQEYGEPSFENDYYLPESKKEIKALVKYWHQRKAAKELLDGIIKYWHTGQQLIAGAGYGKTFTMGAVLSRLVEMGFAKDKQSYGPVKYLYVTKNSVVEQTQRVLYNVFGLTAKDGFDVINYEQLRSKYGSNWVEEKVKIEYGEEVVEWTWRPHLNPVVVIWDENQSLKNYGSTQHNIACSFNDIKTPVYQIFVSATPYVRVSEAKCFAVSTHKDISNMMGPGVRLTNTTWPTYASVIAGDKSSPEEYNEAAVGRLTKDLEPYIVRVRGVKPQFHAINKVMMIDFETKEERDYYDDTEARYFREKAKLEADIKSGKVSGGGLLHLVLLTKRGIAAEFCRVNHFARLMYEAVQQGKAAACAVKYKPTLIKIVKVLHEKYGVNRDNISLVWGGGQTQLTKKQKAKAELMANADKMTGDIKETLMRGLGLEDVEDRVLEELPEDLRLGGQNKDERQREIDRFQAGKSLYCIYTFKAGGVGLSLHHTDELTKEKVRREKNGYARTGEFEPYKDSNGVMCYPISRIPTRQRVCFLSVAYSAIDMVQSTGRVPRLTSLSDTEQYCILYNGTVEVDIAHIYSSKLRCLNQVTRTRESWIDLIVSGDRKSIVEAHIKDDEDRSKKAEEDDEPLDESEDEE
jgi:hypothetical protein